ncbi:RluA family pseudouridine synthase [Nosocomiicoccus massiliensis]|uniref:Pseudouridine synthase n=1 Tax=Nosocomiicoccus massiliensis TaxID=1232430 RepID=A0AAF0YIF3_9STAP|nr:RluA family pseudouridine synthase [Nosocomiicoccus massiliensis]WOS96213.1 RluA family pseudouridine synthase [Nosocomiicoccus massiliensis]
MNKVEIKIEEKDVNVRIDKLLLDYVENSSRTEIQNRLKEGNIVVNGDEVKPNYKVKLGDVIKVFEREVEDVDIIPEDLNLNIVYEDDNVAVVYKPSGMVVHPSAGHKSNTLVNGLMYALDSLSGINGEYRPGIVHRIDKDTSGLLMVAKNDVAHRDLSDQLKDKTVDRRYVALVHGEIQHNKGTIDAPIGRNKEKRQQMAVVDDGKNAVTHFNVLERFNGYTLIEAILETGRTHQIRVHMDYIGYPIVGDPVYGRKTKFVTDGQLLHAKTIGFTHPVSKERLSFSSELPEQFKTVLEELRLEKS